MRNWIVCAALVAAQASFAATIPKPSEFDKRIRIAAYNPLDVYEVKAYYGYDIHIYLSPGEQIETISFGDDQAWTIGPKKPRNHFFFKPKEDKPTTNMTVVSRTRQGEERSYVFHVSAEWPSEDQKKSDDMIYAVRFTYPDEEAKVSQAVHSREQIKDKLSNAVTEKVRNLRYSFSGSESLEPEEVFDDGTFTYIKFAANRALPAIYLVNEDGSEQLTDAHDDDEYRIVRRVVERLIFRKGNAVAGVFNDAYDPIGAPNRTGTVSPEVKRVLKRGE